MMSPDDPEPVPTTAPGPAVGPEGKAADRPRGSREMASSARPGLRSWVLVLAAGLAAGLIAWAVAEAALVPEIGIGTRGSRAARRLPADVGLRNGMVSFGALGAVMGLSLGLAGGLIRRSVRAEVLAAVTGLVLGGAVGAGAARLLVPVYYENMRSNNLIFPLIVHGGTWAALGAAAGLAFGWGLGGWRTVVRSALGAAGAALLATIIYDFAGAALFPLAMTDRPISLTWESRLLARLLVAVLAAAGALLCGWPGALGGSRE
jgi:hypothetical protein